MTVTIGSTAPDNRRLSRDRESQRTYVVTKYLTVTEGTSDLAILNALPASGAIYSGDPRASLERVDVDIYGTCGENYKATLVYSTQPRNSCAEDSTDNPLEQPPEIVIDFEQFQRPIDVDLNQKPIRASSREVFNPRPEIDDSRPVVFITQNESSLDLPTIVAYQDAVNSDSIWGLDPGQAKIRVSAQRQQYKQDDECFTYWRKTYAISIRREGWLMRLADMGLHQWSSIFERPVPIKGNDDEPITELVFLDGEGAILADTADPVILDFEVYRELPFAVLGLPSSLE